MGQEFSSVPSRKNEQQLAALRESFQRFVVFMRDRQQDGTLSAERAAGLAGLFLAMTRTDAAEVGAYPDILPPPHRRQQVLEAPDSAFKDILPTTANLRRVRSALSGVADILCEYLPTFAAEIGDLIHSSRRRR